jgi:iron complex outermembrane receptor protein
MFLLLIGICFQADTLIPLREVVIKQPTENAVGSVEQFLSKNPSLQWVRRGNYAAEPQIHGLSSERSIISLDGMRIYPACTDKMDPVTSYLEITQLETGQMSSSHGPSISGGLDLQMRKTGFQQEGISGKFFSGYETNHRHRMAGFQISTAKDIGYADLNVSHRKAEDYTRAGRQKVPFSGFTKNNISLQTGYKPRSNEEWEAGLIYDLAKDVGYPALPMDVGKAEALITFAQYTRHLPYAHWKTRLYHNRIAHRMDDSKRPDLPIRMDMPGWSNTSGLYSQITRTRNNHHLNGKFSAHTNYAFADMTMFSKGEKDMYMLTWPGVRTSEIDLFIEDKFQVSSSIALHSSAGLSMQRQSMQENFKGLHIFFPNAPRQRYFLLPRLSAGLQTRGSSLGATLNLGYSERGPSVSEAYGYYLFNSSDRFDYIGFPEIKKEKGIRLTWQGKYQTSVFKTQAEITSFFLKDYILGVVEPHLHPMTLGGAGVKIYRNLPSATIIRMRWEGNVNLQKGFFFKASAVRQFGNASAYGNLPFMQPLTVQGTLRWDTKHLGLEYSVEMADKQKRVDIASNEMASPSYVVMHVQGSTKIGPLQIRMGMENVWDTLYTTYSDWNKIPRMGRNVFLNLIWNF